MASLLIVGGAGYVGSHTAKALRQVGHDCIVFDNFSTGHRDFVKWGPTIEGDIRDGAALDRAFRDHPVDAVLHFAARAYVGESVVAPGLYYDVNVGGTRSLLDSMVRAGVRKIIFSSTCAVYGGQAPCPITETHEARPINPYGFTKLVCERMLEDFRTAHGLESVRLRYFNAAGADPECEVGEHHDPEPHLIPLVLDVAAGRRPSVSIFGTDYPTPDGTAVRDYVHVADLASAHLAATRHLLDNGSSATLNLGTGAGVSVREIVNVVQEVTGRHIAVKEEDRRPGDPAALYADPTQARALLSWEAKRSDLRTMLADAWAWHLRRFGDAHNQRNEIGQ